MPNAGVRDPLFQVWRVGHPVDRLILAMSNELKPSDADVLIGIMDNKQLAIEVVNAHNRWLAFRTSPETIAHG